MAVTNVSSNNKLVKYTTEINREWVRGNAFSPYQSESLNAIIRIRTELEGKNGGEQMNIPLVRRLQGQGKGVGTLVGNEEKIDNYGQRAWIDWKRNAVATTKADQHKDSADIFGETKPLLSDWMNEAKRDELIAAFMSLPSESPPANLGSDNGDTVNGIRYEDATATQRNTWNADNSDRVLYGEKTSNYNATHSTALANVGTTNGTLTYQNLSLLKRMAKNANPKIRPYRVEGTKGREYYVAFAGSNTFRDLSNSLLAIDQAARAREADGMKDNPIYQDGDLLYRGVIVREVPEISSFVTNVWTSLLTAGASSVRVEPVFLCGQQAAYMAIGQMARPTFRKEDDYGMIKGVGIEAAYGVGKMFSKSINNTKLIQWGVVTGFFAGVSD